jgi:hypothetical protein
MSTTRTARSRSIRSRAAAATAVADFLDAQQRVMDRYLVDAERRFVSLTVGGSRCGRPSPGRAVAALHGGERPRRRRPGRRDIAAYRTDAPHTGCASSSTCLLWEVVLGTAVPIGAV